MLSSDIERFPAERFIQLLVKQRDDECMDLAGVWLTLPGLSGGGTIFITDLSQEMATNGWG